MGPQSYAEIRGYVVTFLIQKIFDDRGTSRFDVEIALTNEWRASSSTIRARFVGVRDVRYGDAHEGIDFGAYLFLSIDDVSEDGWEGIRFKAVNVENSCPLSLYCQALEVLDGGTDERST